MGSEKTPTEVLAEVEQATAVTKTADELLLESLEQQIAAKRGDPAIARKIQDAKDDLEYLGLVEKFAAVGKLGQKYSIVDVTSHGKGFIVLVNGPKAEVHRKTIVQLVKEDKLSEAKLLEITRDYVKHPTLEVFDALVSEVPAVQDVCIAAVQDLWGARARIRLEK